MVDGGTRSDSINCAICVPISASVRIESLGFPSWRGPMQRGHPTRFLRVIDSTVKESPHFGQLMILFSCSLRTDFTWAGLK